MVETLTIIAGVIGTLVGTVTSVFYFKRAKKAEVVSAEINTADQMIDLVKKANAEALEINKKDNEKLRKSIVRLERALRVVSACKYYGECPVPIELQHTPPEELINQRNGKDNQERSLDRC